MYMYICKYCICQVVAAPSLRLNASVAMPLEICLLDSFKRDWPWLADAIFWANSIRPHGFALVPLGAFDGRLCCLSSASFGK